MSFALDSSGIKEWQVPDTIVEELRNLPSEDKAIAERAFRACVSFPPLESCKPSSKRANSALLPKQASFPVTSVYSLDSQTVLLRHHKVYDSIRVYPLCRSDPGPIPSSSFSISKSEYLPSARLVRKLNGENGLATSLSSAVAPTELLGPVRPVRESGDQLSLNRHGCWVHTISCTVAPALLNRFRASASADGDRLSLSVDKRRSTSGTRTLVSVIDTPSSNPSSAASSHLEIVEEQRQGILRPCECPINRRTQMERLALLWRKIGTGRVVVLHDDFHYDSVCGIKVIRPGSIEAELK